MWHLTDFINCCSHYLITMSDNVKNISFNMLIWFMNYYLAKAFNILFMIRYGHLSDWPDQHWDVRFQGDLPRGVPKVAQRVPEEQDGRRRSQPLDADRGTGEARLKLWLGLSWWLKLVSRLKLTLWPSLNTYYERNAKTAFPCRTWIKDEDFYWPLAANHLTEVTV